MRGGDADDVVAKLGDLAARAGLHRVSMLAWRDLDDPEAGGSEVHASKVAALWGEAGIEVTMRTSHAPGYRTVSWRDGYRVIRKGGRYMVFPRGGLQRDDGLARRQRRARRDLERHAVLLAGVGAPPARHVAAPRARHDVGDDAAAAARAPRAFDGVPPRAAAVPAHADRDALGIVETRPRVEAALQGKARARGASRASSRGSRRPGRRLPTRSSSRSAGSCR